MNYFSRFVNIFIIDEIIPFNYYWAKFSNFSGYLFANMIFSPFLLLYCLRIRWDKPPRIIWYAAIAWSFIMVFSSFETFYFYIFYLYIKANHLILFDSLTAFNRIIVLGITLLVYSLTKQEIIDKRVNSARKLWILGGSFLVILPVLSLIIIISGYSVLWESLQVISNLIGLLIIAYTTIRYPEAVLFSKAQIIRALDIYPKALSMKLGTPVQEFGISALVDYLNKIPLEQFTKND